MRDEEPGIPNAYPDATLGVFFAILSFCSSCISILRVLRVLGGEAFLFLRVPGALGGKALRQPYVRV